MEKDVDTRKNTNTTRLESTGIPSILGSDSGLKRVCTTPHFSLTAPSVSRATTCV